MSIKEVIKKADGRYLILYWRDNKPTEIQSFSEPSETLPAGKNQLRWNPVLSEWVGNASHRQGRTFFPPADFCPLCITKSAEFVSEIPRNQYHIAVFENKFPAFIAEQFDLANSIDSSLDSVDDLYRVAPARGACEVIVYSPDHQATLTDLPLNEIRHLIDVWSDRFLELSARDYIKYVYIFENKGREIGVTLPHPHGQIYAFPFIPPLPAKELQSSAKYFAEHQRCLFCDILKREKESARIVAENESFLAFIPFYARWPYETHVYAKRHINAISDLDHQERDHLAQLLKKLLRQFDNLWQRSFPYIMLMHQRPSDGADYDHYHFHIEFYPPYRTTDKLKYLAGVESGCAVFLNDTIAEEKAAELRNATSKINSIDGKFNE